MVITSKRSLEKTVILTSLEWPPYTSGTLVGGGAAAVVATEAFHSMGYKLIIHFYPWNRAVAEAKITPSVAGYFPEYMSPENRENFTYSEPLGTGVLGFVEKSDQPIFWSELKDLRSRIIGVVPGYLNTSTFDRLRVTGQIQVSGAENDATNVIKVAQGRIPMAIIDREVLDYLVDHDPGVTPYRGRVQFNSRPLGVTELFICFKKGLPGESWAEIFQEGLSRIDSMGIFSNALNAISK